MYDRPLQHGTSSCLMVAILAPNCRFLLSSVSNQTALASTLNTSAPVMQQADMTDSHQVALFYHPVYSALRSPPLIATAWERHFISLQRDHFCECNNGGTSAATSFSNLMHMYFKRHGFATSQVLAFFFFSLPARASELFCDSKVLLCSKGFRTVQLMKTWVLTKITGTLVTHSGYLEKKNYFDLTNDRLQNWQTANFRTD